MDKLDLMTFQTLQTQVASVVRPDDDGKFKLDGLEPGTYTLIAIAFDESPSGPEDFDKARVVTELVELGKNETKEVNLTVPLN